MAYLIAIMSVRSRCFRLLDAAVDIRLERQANEWWNWSEKFQEIMQAGSKF
jgi:hypothetical protein